MLQVTNITKAKLFLLISILFFSFYIRVYNVDRNPAGFFCDEASIGYNAYTILKTGTDEYGVKLPLFFRAFGEYKNPVFIYSAIPLIAMFGLSEWTVRLTSVIYGTLSILAIYLLARKLFNEKIALFSALFLAISPWHIHMSRVGFELISSVFWITISLYLLLKSLEKFWFFPIAIGSLIIAFLTYNSPKLTIPFLLFGLFFIYIKKIKKLLTDRRYWLSVLAGIVVLLFLVGPSIKDGSFFARWQQVKPEKITLQEILVGYSNHFSFQFLFTKGDIDFPGQFVTRHSVRGMGELYSFQAILLVASIIALYAYKSFRRSLFTVFLLLILYPLGSIFTDTAPQATRSVIGVVPFQILSSVGLYYLLSLLKHRAVRYVAISVFTVVITFSFIQFWYLLKIYPSYSFDFWGWQQGPRAIVQYFLTQTDNYDELYMTGAFNGPEIFLKFYDPDQRCDNCFLGGVDKKNSAKKQLFALTPVEVNDYGATSFAMKKVIYYPDGKVAFLIGELQ